MPHTAPTAAASVGAAKPKTIDLKRKDDQETAPYPPPAREAEVLAWPSPLAARGPSSDDTVPAP